MATFVGIYLLWFMIPMLTNMKNQVWSFINQTDPAIAQPIAIGNAFYLALTAIIALIVGYTIFAVATRRIAVDV